MDRILVRGDQTEDTLNVIIGPRPLVLMRNEALDEVLPRVPGSVGKKHVGGALVSNDVTPDYGPPIDLQDLGGLDDERADRKRAAVGSIDDVLPSIFLDRALEA